jgi:hypothetical protein
MSVSPLHPDRVRCPYVGCSWVSPVVGWGSSMQATVSHVMQEHVSLLPRDQGAQEQRR